MGGYVTERALRNAAINSSATIITRAKSNHHHDDQSHIGTTILQVRRPITRAMGTKHVTADKTSQRGVDSGGLRA